MRISLASLSAPLRAAARRHLSSFRQGSKSIPRSFAPASAAAAIAAAGAAFYTYSSRAETSQAPAPASDAAALEAAAALRAGTVVPGLPDYTLEQISQHKTSGDRIWVTYRNAVYDVTEFVENHPGGMKRIMLAAGSSIDQYWNMYAVHRQEQVLRILESHRIGNVAPKDRKPDSAFIVDLFGNEPSRSSQLTVINPKPYSAETPSSSIAADFITPNHLFFVRNHLPVPHVDPAAFMLTVTGDGIPEPIQLSLDDLKAKFHPVDLTATIMCGGNRRNELNAVAEIPGLKWSSNAISNAQWRGVRLRDVLLHAGFNFNDKDVHHVQFEGLDRGVDGAYGASIPLDVAAEGDVVLAYEMNGQPLPIDHGFPLRAVVPGVVGARNVKWLHKISTSCDESSSPWQQSDYKLYPQTVRTLAAAKGNMALPIQSTPVLSAIVSPPANSAVAAGTALAVKGYAWSGGGNSILRVEVSSDGGKTWSLATMNTPPPHLVKVPPPLAEAQSSGYRSYTWTPWSATVTAPAAGDMQIVCRALDSQHNRQPENLESVWNVRGLLNNSYHRVNVSVRNGN